MNEAQRLVPRLDDARNAGLHPTTDTHSATPPTHAPRPTHTSPSKNGSTHSPIYRAFVATIYHALASSPPLSISPCPSHYHYMSHRPPLPLFQLSIVHLPFTPLPAATVLPLLIIPSLLFRLPLFYLSNLCFALTPSSLQLSSYSRACMPVVYRQLCSPWHPAPTPSPQRRLVPQLQSQSTAPPQRHTIGYTHV